MGLNTVASCFLMNMPEDGIELTAVRNDSYPRRRRPLDSRWLMPWEASCAPRLRGNLSCF